MRLACSLTTTLIATLLANPAAAAGFFVQDVGLAGIARQGAVTASGEDLTALWYNPANLAAGRGLRLQADINVNWKDYVWQRAADPALGTFAEVRSQLALVAVPSFALAYDFAVPGLAAALGVYAPNNSDTKFDKDGAQRYSVVKAGSFIVFFHAGLAYQPVPWLRLGAGVFATSVFFDQSLAVNLGIGGPENPDFDVFVSVYGTQHLLMNGNFGVWLRPGAGFELGASFIPGRRAQARGTLAIEPPRALADLLQVSGNHADFTVDFPWLVRGGVAWRHLDLIVAEANVVYEGWSSVKAILIRPREIALSVPPLINDVAIGDITLERGWRDTVSLRIGGEMLVYRPLGLRVKLGYGFEPGAVPDAMLSVSSNDTTKHNVGGGLSLAYGRWAFALAYGHSFYVPVAVTDSRMRLTNPLNPDLTTVIGNGRYRFGHDVISTSVSVGFL